MAHKCHATGCNKPVPPDMLMCATHWFKVPPAIRARVWSTYRKGQEVDKSPSREYCLAAKAAVEAVAKREGKEPDTRLYDVFLPPEEE